MEGLLEVISPATAQGDRFSDRGECDGTGQSGESGSIPLGSTTNGPQHVPRIAGGGVKMEPQDQARADEAFLAFCQERGLLPNEPLRDAYMAGFAAGFDWCEKVAEELDYD